MKGIVVDIKGKYAVVLSREGGFIKIRNNGYMNIGCEIDLNQPAVLNTNMLARVSSIAAAFLCTLGLSYSAYSYSMPYSYVGVDINPSIELTANIYDRIIKTEALNNEGQLLLKSGGFNNKKLEAGVNELIDTAVRQGYLKTETENTVFLTVTSKDEDKSSQLKKELKSSASKELNDVKVDSLVVVEKASVERHEDAKKIGITSGKLLLIEKAIEKEPDLRLDDLKDVPVKEIMRHIKDSSTEVEKKNNIQSKQESKQENKQQNKQQNFKKPAVINEKDNSDNKKTVESENKTGSRRNNDNNPTLRQNSKEDKKDNNSYIRNKTSNEENTNTDKSRNNNNNSNSKENKNTKNQRGYNKNRD